VLGRGVENLILESLGRLAVAHDADEIEFVVAHTGKNEPALQFLLQECDRHGAEGRPKISSHHAIGSRDRAMERWKNPPAPEQESPLERGRPPVYTGHGIPNSTVSKIAERLCSPSAILEGLHTSPSQGHSQDSVPRTQTETILSEIWEDLLHLTRPGIYQDFFEAGGTSVLAVRFLAEVKRRISVEVPVASFFAVDATIEKLSALIDELQMSKNGDAAAHGIASISA
jgi:hypothetical protein